MISMKTVDFENGWSRKWPISKLTDFENSRFWPVNWPILKLAVFEMVGFEIIDFWMTDSEVADFKIGRLYSKSTAYFPKMTIVDRWNDKIYSNYDPRPAIFGCELTAKSIENRCKFFLCCIVSNLCSARLIRMIPLNCFCDKINRNWLNCNTDCKQSPG